MENGISTAIVFVAASIIITVLLLLIIFFTNRYRKRTIQAALDYQKELQHKEQELQEKLQANKPDLSFTVGSERKKVKLNSPDILFVKSDGNYIEIATSAGRTVTRERISNFFDLVPDPESYIRVHRSYIIRKDKVTEKSHDALKIGTHTIKVSEQRREELESIHF